MIKRIHRNCQIITLSNTAKDMWAVNTKAMFSNKRWEHICSSFRWAMWNVHLCFNHPVILNRFYTNPSRFQKVGIRPPQKVGDIVTLKDLIAHILQLYWRPRIFGMRRLCFFQDLCAFHSSESVLGIANILEHMNRMVFLNLLVPP